MPITIDGNNTPTAGGIGYGDGTELAFTSAGSSGQVLTSNGASAPAFAAIPATNLATGVTGTLPVGNGGTGANTLTANNVLLGNGASALQTVAPGANGNVLTSNGTTWTSSTPAAGGSQTFTASTSITAGQAVSLDSSGQVKACGIDPAVLGSAVGYSGVTAITGYDSVNSKYVICYLSGSSLFAVAGTITAGVLTLGTPATIATNVYTITSLSHDTVQNVFVAAWQTASTILGRATAFSLSGSTINVGGTLNVYGSLGYSFSVVYAPGKQCHAVYYSDDSVNPSQGYYTTIYTTGIASIAKTGTGNIGINYPQGGRLTWYPEGDRAVCFLRWAQGGQNSFKMWITISGTGGSSSASHTLDNYNDYQYTDAGSYYDPVSGYVIQMVNGPPGYRAVVSNSSLVTTSTVAFPSTYVPYGFFTANQKIVTIGTQSYVFAYSASPYYPTLIPFTITSGTISFSTPIILESVANGYTFGVVVGVAPQCIYVQSATSNAYPYAPAASNISSFIGISQNTVSSTQTTTVNILGGVNTNVTGLTTNTTYYLDNSGALTSSSSTGIKVGRALSATSLLVTGGQG